MEININVRRLTDEFKELVAVDSLSLKEGRMTKIIKKKVAKLGFEVKVDDSAERIGGETGNLIATRTGEPGARPVFFAAHMDTVSPGSGKTAVEKDGVITSDGSTVLGGDDLGGIACLLEGIRAALDSGMRLGEIQLIFTVAEEIGLVGARNLDYSLVHAKEGYVLDHGGKPGSVCVGGPAQDDLEIQITGKPAHAGVEPEKGISAIQVFAHGVSKMHLGRIDGETTANIGIVQAGSATNIVCGSLWAKAEVRSRNMLKLTAQVEHMKHCLERTAEEFGAKADIKVRREYEAYQVREDEPVMVSLRKAAAQAGIEVVPEQTGGGSDTNIFHARGLRAVNLSIGMERVHTLEERIAIADMAASARMVAEILRVYGSGE